MIEETFRNTLLRKLKRLNLPYRLDKEVPIPYKHIYVKNDDKVTLEIWCFKQDIVFFKPLFDVNIPYRGATIQYYDQNLINVKLEKDNAQKTKDVGMPFLIIETKCGQSTHDVMTYSQKAELIKTIFPYCKFIFCIYGNVKQRTFRHGLNFDAIVTISNLNNHSQLQKFYRTVCSLMKKSKDELSRLSS